MHCYENPVIRMIKQHSVTHAPPPPEHYRPYSGGPCFATFATLGTLQQLNSTVSLHRPNAWWHNQMKTFPRLWPFVSGINRSSVDPSHKGQWRRALMFSLICSWTNGWTNTLNAGDLRLYRAIMTSLQWQVICKQSGMCEGRWPWPFGLSQAIIKQ